MIQESIENYLETIYMLKLKKSNVRAVDVAEEMGYSKPTISIVIKKLKEQGLLSVETDGNIILSDEAVKIASHIYERHVFLTKMFVSLGVDKETAAEDACKLEHDISDETFECIKEHAKKVLE